MCLIYLLNDLSLVNSIAKESKNMGAKILNKDIFLEDLV